MKEILEEVAINVGAVLLGFGLGVIALIVIVIVDLTIGTPL